MTTLIVVLLLFDRKPTEGPAFDRPNSEGIGHNSQRSEP